MLRLGSTIRLAPSRQDRFLLLATLCLSSPLLAADADTLTELARRFLVDQIGKSNGELRIEVEEPDIGLRPCLEPEFFLPWGQASLRGHVPIGVRCRNDRRTRYLQATVEVYVRYWVSTRTVERGSRLTSEDLEPRLGDQSRLPVDVLLDLNQVNDLVVRHTLVAGTPLRRSQLQPVRLVQRRDSVSVEASGAGFRVVREGLALDAGGAGETIRVRLPNREIIEATVTGDRQARAIWN